MPNYLPFDERRVSTEYQDMLRTIRDTGVRVTTKQGVDALAIAGHSMRFPMAHGAAVITERSIKGFAPKAIGELCAFINGPGRSTSSARSAATGGTPGPASRSA
jgi:thymidylate synthase